MAGSAKSRVVSGAILPYHLYAARPIADIASHINIIHSGNKPLSVWGNGGVSKAAQPDASFIVFRLRHDGVMFLPR